MIVGCAPERGGAAQANAARKASGRFRETVPHAARRGEQGSCVDAP